MTVLNDCQVQGRCDGCPSQASQQPAKVGNDCQLQSLFEDTAPITWRNRLRQFALRMLTAFERRIDRVRRRLSPKALPEPTVAAQSGWSAEPTHVAAASSGPIQPGQWVEILTYDEILAMLDDKGRCDGLEFMEGMRRYCGRRLRVRKLVRMMFDERKWRMLKVKRPRYLLDEAICDGSGMYDKEGCDRSCFYFWTDRWFRNSESSDNRN
jgi:hypothetical protein